MTGSVIAEQCLQRAKAFSAAHTAGRSTRNWEGTQLGQMTPAEQKDIPYHVGPCSATYIKLQEEG